MTWKRFDPDGDLWETDPDSCCHIRKTEPLEPSDGAIWWLG